MAPPTDARPAPPSSGGEEMGLHPLSFLFRVLSKAIAIPLAVVTLLLLGGGDVEREVGGGVMAALMLGAYGLVKSRTFRYRLTGQEIVIREGVLARTERHVPYRRIQNVVLRRTPLHRLFGVTELRLESAGGSRPEAVMAVITLEAARQIESLLREHHGRPDRTTPEGSGGMAPPVAETSTDTELLVSMTPLEVLRLGLASNRSWEAISAVLVLAASQMDLGSASSRTMLARAPRRLTELTGAFGQALDGPAGRLLGALVALGLGLVLLKALSVAMAFLFFHGFRLQRRGQRLSTEGGLLDRRVSSVGLQKIQRLCVSESWLARRMGRRSLACAVDAGRDQSDDRLSWLVPLAPRAEVDRVLAAVAPGVVLEGLPWRPLHPKAWRRRLAPRLLLVAPAAGAAFWALGPWGSSLGVGMLLLALLEARAWARFAAFACEGRVLAFRSGSWRRQWRFTWLAHAQSVGLTSSPLDRRHGMATVALDTAGVSETAPALRIPFLPEGQARTLARDLQQRARTSAGGQPGADVQP